MAQPSQPHLLLAVAQAASPSLDLTSAFPAKQRRANRGVPATRPAEMSFSTVVLLLAVGPALIAGAAEPQTTSAPAGEGSDFVGWISQNDRCESSIRHEKIAC